MFLDFLDFINDVGSISNSQSIITKTIFNASITYAIINIVTILEFLLSYHILRKNPEIIVILYKCFR